MVRWTPASCSHGSAGKRFPLWSSVSWVPGWSLPCVLNVLHVPSADKDLFHTCYTTVDLLKSLTKTWSAAPTAFFSYLFWKIRISLNDSNKVLCDNRGRWWPCLGPCASRWIRITWSNAHWLQKKPVFKVLLVICDIQVAFNLNTETDVQDRWGVGRGGILGTILESHAAVKCRLTPESHRSFLVHPDTATDPWKGTVNGSFKTTLFSSILKSTSFFPILLPVCVCIYTCVCTRVCACLPLYHCIHVKVRDNLKSLL